MTTLHIIGNGFDLAHGIESSYSDFKKYAWDNCKDGYNLGLLEKCYPQMDEKTGDLLLWSDLEKALGKMDFPSAFNESTEDIELEEDHEGRYQAQMEDAPGYFLPMMFDNFHNIFEEWVNNIDLSGVRHRNIPHFDKDGIFLSFNYTETIELLYGVKNCQINHIHGKRNAGEDLVVGHCNYVNGDDELSDDPEIFEYHAYDEMARIVNEQRKNSSDIIAVNQKFWESLFDISKVVVYGHSLSNVDAPYFNKVIDSIQQNVEWYFSVYYDNPIKEAEELKRVNNFITLMGLDPTKCHAFVM